MNIFILRSLFLLAGVSLAAGSNILLVPWVGMFNSRFNSMIRLADMMVEDGHQVTVLTPLFLTQYIKSKKVEVLTFNMPQMADLSDLNFADAESQLDIGKLTGQYYLTGFANRLELAVCEHFYEDKVVQKKLKERHFDLVFADCLYTFGRLVIDFMEIPGLLYSPDGTTYDSDLFYPTIPSFVCPPYKGFCGGDSLPFWTRVHNLISQIGIHYYMIPTLTNPIDTMREKYGIKTKAPARETFRRHVILANLDSVMEPVKPMMPHVIPVSGLFVKVPQPLKDGKHKAHMESADKGAIIMSMGTLVSSMPKEKNEIIAKVFSGLPQKVLWKYTGEPLTAVGKNTLLTEWLAQPDLLAHRNAKLFITHGGSHSMFEAGHRGIPVVCIPFFLDQFTHCKTLTQRLDMGIMLEPGKITEESFNGAVNEVLSNPKYSANAKKIQFILQDQPMKSRDLFLYWVNYTIRHNGAHHLISDAPFEMYAFQYWSLDVVAFLLGVPLVGIYLLACICKRLCRKDEAIKVQRQKKNK